MSSDAATTIPVGPDADSDAARDTVVSEQHEADVACLCAWHFFEATSDYADRAKHFMDRLHMS